MKLPIVQQQNKPWVNGFFNNSGELKVLLLCLSLFAAASVQAHPHSWVDTKTVIQGSDSHISGFHMSWSFDAMTSMYMLDGEDLSPENRAETLQKLADSVIENMYNEHYFTYFYDDEKPVKYKTAQNAQLKQDKAKLILSFDLPLSKPQPLTADSLRLLIFEPSYYIDMSWKKSADIELSEALTRSCLIDLIAPNPTAEQMSYALSLPDDADPDNELGQLFTQTVKLKCREQNAH
ncbi:DUF1007 family protein [Psychromonas ossibalaenae]|uniref:DUF1007 family protein n=1 Tax=Psychromonas ossibalaenae TaxID=444922 RepID=UPI000362EC5C|nr:DUF1007 family protein [Psychromonas ossibalaenae]